MNRGAGVAPWNIQQYALSEKNGLPYVNDQPVVFYHYHQFSRYPDGTFEFGTYPFTSEAIRLFYVPYIRAIQQSEKEVAEIDPNFHFFKQVSPPPSLLEGITSGKFSELKKALKPFKRKLTGTYNVYSASDF
jgi:hypothetical protein